MGYASYVIPEIRKEKRQAVLDLKEKITKGNGNKNA